MLQRSVKVGSRVAFATAAMVLGGVLAATPASADNSGRGGPFGGSNGGFGGSSSGRGGGPWSWSWGRGGDQGDHGGRGGRGDHDDDDHGHGGNNGNHGDHGGIKQCKGQAFVRDEERSCPPRPRCAALVQRRSCCRTPSGQVICPPFPPCPPRSPS